MAKLAYYADKIPGKEHWFETPEGYIIYTSCPICRTGQQDYLGSELRNHPDFKAEWNIEDTDIVTVNRPLSVVTSPEALASFEGKSVLDNHPPDDVGVVYVGNEADYGRGHCTNIRVGAVLEDGETPLLADLFVKNEALNDKIRNGEKDLSCGYVYGLKRNDDGSVEMTKIRGNHVAVVSKGRAGPEVSIRDKAFSEAAPPAIPSPEPPALAADSGKSVLSTTEVKAVDSIRIETPEEKDKPTMAVNKTGSIFGRMLKAFATDAEPDEIAEAAKFGIPEKEDSEILKALRARSTRDAEKEEEDKEKEKEKKSASDKAAKDKADEEEKAVKDKAAKDAAEKDKGELEPELHPRLAEACDCISSLRDSMEEIKNHFGLGSESAKDSATTMDGEANVLELSPDDDGKSTLPEQIAANDAASASAELLKFLNTIKPAIAAYKDKSVRDSYNSQVVALRGKQPAVKAPARASAYSALTGGNPASVRMSNAMSDASSIDPMTFFNGVPYAIGKQRYEDFMAKKGTN
jgi:Uncharacterized protein conserved in bacteria (DUF2213)